jgi:hypothetical protein
MKLDSPSVSFSLLGLMISDSGISSSFMQLPTAPNWQFDRKVEKEADGGNRERTSGFSLLPPFSLVPSIPFEPVAAGIPYWGRDDPAR